MFALDLNNVGCGQKLGMDLIGSIAPIAGFDPDQDSGCDEFFGFCLCSSIDRIGRFSQDVELFAEISLLHAINDLVVSGVEPLTGTACIEFGPEFVSPDEFAKLSTAVANAFKQYGVQLQNLHSVRSEYTYLTISTTGIMKASPYSGSKNGRVFLSRRIGAFKMLVLRELDDEEATDFIEEIVKKRFYGCFSSDVIATDITGYGLARAAFGLCRQLGVHADISLGQHLLVHEDALSIPMRCFDVQGSPASGITFLSERAGRVSKLMEVAGPTLMFVPDPELRKFQEEYSKIHQTTPIEVGRFFDCRDDIGVTFAWID